MLSTDVRIMLHTPPRYWMLALEHFYEYWYLNRPYFEHSLSFPVLHFFLGNDHISWFLKDFWLKLSFWGLDSQVQYPAFNVQEGFYTVPLTNKQREYINKDLLFSVSKSFDRFRIQSKPCAEYSRGKELHHLWLCGGPGVWIFNLPATCMAS